MCSRRGRARTAARWLVGAGGGPAVKDRDGRWQATEVHIFPESMRGAGEGHYAWDLPESTMTNGAATGIVAKGRGGTINVRHAGGTVEIDVTRRTEIVGLTMGSRALLVRGAAVLAIAQPVQGGAALAVAIIAETNGVKPPMQRRAGQSATLTLTITSP